MRRWSNITLTLEVKAGNYVLLHAGYAKGIVDKVEAVESLKLLEEITTPGEVR